MVTLIDFDSLDISRDSNLWLMDVAESQKHHVANPQIILGRAYVFRQEHPRVFWIFSGDTPVGMALYYDDPEAQAYDLSQIFIDQHHQGQGYGRAAIRLLLEQMRAEGRYQKARVCCVEDNCAAIALFSSLGFVEISHLWDEIFLERPL